MKRLISLLLSLVMLLTLVTGMNVTAYAADYTNTATPVKANTLTTGDTFQMGIYPQSVVKDTAIKTALSAISCTMNNYDYIQNSDASTQTYDEVNMKYADISYNGNLYRKVEINEYRPYLTYKTSSSVNSNQKDNGYTIGTYYFKWEPIVWQVLAKEEDGVYVMSKELLDSQVFYNFNENTSWEKSTLRAWMNNDFYNAAFSASEKSKINSFNDEPRDTLRLLSANDIINTNYGFSNNLNSDISRMAEGTDYAKSQGIYVYTNNSEYYGASNWWYVISAAYTDFKYSREVSYDGSSNKNTIVCTAYMGIRPAFKLKLNSEIAEADDDICRIAGHTWKLSANEDKHWHACTVCGIKNDEAEHNYSMEWSANDEKHWHECTTCFLKKDELTHVFSEWTSVNGIDHKRTCKCGFEETEAHAFGEWTPVDDTNHKHTCKCGAEETEAHTYSIPEYAWSETDSVTAVCQCGTCSDVCTEIVETTSVTVSPTCTEKGYSTYTATFTNPLFGQQTKTVEDADALGHDYVSTVTVPTCTEQGYTTYTCTRCDDAYKADYVNALGHTYGKEGNARFTCTVCGFINESLKAAAEKADKEAAEKAEAERRAAEKAEKARIAAEKAAQEAANAAFVSGVNGTAAKNKATVKWGKVKGADRYVIYAAYCGKKTKYKKIKTVKGSVTKYDIKKLNGKKLNPKKNVKVYVVAQKKNGKKYKTLFKTPTFHIAGAQNAKHTNVKKIKVKKNKFNLAVGKTAKIKPTAVLENKSKTPIDHVAKYRYISANTAVATVSKKGKIKAVGKGTCTIYVYSCNGTAKAIKVKVK